MTTYIMLMNWTEQGAKNVRDSPKRLDAARKQLGEMGGSFKAFYLTMGEYDMVAVVEAPDDAVLARFALMLAANGNLKSRTLKAFPEFAYREIISSLG
ncbi:GYD domain-containing protein [Mesorhizobium sp. 113-3-3]|uniref:GYD domain-containing protein n=1 Tax=Mesorhizobium sp. 113-3-3 TaxID=2744516 RepID=UPI0019276B92|nr:GYD domain-containing protein [Mesorhizobium sp. 113-3-3]BCG78901.1 GYD family protein [Mesorhizobium sp. 113-3-3]